MNKFDAPRRRMNNRASELRISAGFTKRELSRRLGVREQTYTKYETRELRPTVELIRKVAELFGVSPDELMSQQDLDSSSLRQKRVRGGW